MRTRAWTSATREEEEGDSEEETDGPDEEAAEFVFYGEGLELDEEDEEDEAFFSGLGFDEGEDGLLI